MDGRDRWDTKSFSERCPYLKSVHVKTINCFFCGHNSCLWSTWGHRTRWRSHWWWWWFSRIICGPGNAGTWMTDSSCLFQRGDASATRRNNWLSAVSQRGCIRSTSSSVAQIRSRQTICGIVRSGVRLQACERTSLWSPWPWMMWAGGNKWVS